MEVDLNSGWSGDWRSRLGLSDSDLKEMNRVRPDSMVFIGVDLGQRGSHSAILVLERFEEWPVELVDVLRSIPPRMRYVVRQAERIALGTEYKLVVARLKQVVQRIVLTGRSCAVVVDEGGPGVAVVERMREVRLGCPIFPYTITGGGVATAKTVSRVDLVTKMQMMAQHGELEIAEGCLHGEQLHKELVYLKLEKTGEADDMAMGLGLACWKARVR